MKTKTPKMTEQEKFKQNAGSRFIRHTPAPSYADYVARDHDTKYKYDAKGRRVF